MTTSIKESLNMITRCNRIKTNIIGIRYVMAFTIATPHHGPLQRVKVDTPIENPLSLKSWTKKKHQDMSASRPRRRRRL